jgi:VCBS repeat-containing protein
VDKTGDVASDPELGAVPPREAASGQAAAFPEPGFRFTTHHVQAGTEFIIVGTDGHSSVMQDEREGEKIAALGGAAMVSPAWPAGSSNLPHYAQAADPSPSPASIGRVEKISGHATITRNGALIEVHQGDPLFKGDTVQTASGGSLTIKFIDGTVFALSASARIILNEMIYSASSTGNSALFELVQGLIGFVAGKAAETGDFRVETPVATMGIRGTAIRVEISAADGATRFSLLTEPNGTAGSFVLYDKFNPSRVIRTVSDPHVATLVVLAGAAQVNAAQVIKTPDELRSDNLFVHDIFQSVGPEPGQRRGSGDFEGLSPLPVLGGIPSPDSPELSALIIPRALELAQVQVELPLRDIVATGSAVEDGPLVVLRGINGGAGRLPRAEFLPAGVLYNEATGEYTLNPSDPAYQSLGAGETTTVSVRLSTMENGRTVPVILSWTITGENDAPVVTVVDPRASVEKDTSERVSFNLFGLVTASDIDRTDTPAFAAGSAVVAATAGADTTDASLISINQATGEISYDRASFNFLGAGESAIYTISFDVVSGSDRIHEVVTLTITGENDAPIVSTINPAIGAEKDSSEQVSFNLFGLVTAVDADQTDTPAYKANSVLVAAAAGSNITDTGLISVNEATGVVSYDRADFNSLGSGEAAIYTISFDVVSGTDTSQQTVKLTIMGENDTPVVTVVDPSAGAEKDTSERVSFNLFTDLTTAHDIDRTDTPGFAAGSALVAAAVGSDTTNTSLISVNQATGEISYDRENFNFLGAGESAIYSISFDVVSGADRIHKVVTLTITGENDAPVAKPDDFRGIHETSPTTLDVLSNDFDIDGDRLTITHWTQPREGTVFLNASGELVFDPGKDFETLSAGQTATVSFDYTIADNSGGTASEAATVHLEGSGQFTSPLHSAPATGTLPVNGQSVSIELEAPERTTTSSVDIGLDIAFGAQRPMNILYIVDISGSTGDEFEGTPTGDLNRDGESNTILDAEIDGLIKLTEQVRSLGFSPRDVSVTVIPFDASADPASNDAPSVSFRLGTSGDETIANFLKSLSIGGGTNFENALQAAVEKLHALDPDGNENNIVYFLSDGFGSGSFADEVTTLNSVFETQIAAIGIGGDARLDRLDQIDNTGGAERVTSSDELNAALVGTFRPGEVVDLQIFVNGREIPGIGLEDLVETENGLALDVSAMDLSLHAGEINRVLASVTFTDGLTLTTQLGIIGALPWSTDL